MNKKIGVLVVDDHALFRKGLVGLLKDQADFRLVGEAESGPEAVEMTLQLRPDVVLMDLHMPGGSGVDAVRRIKHNFEPGIIMLTISERDEDLIAAIAAGADGYLLKNTEPEQLYQAIRDTASGQGVLSPEITAKVMRVAARSYKQSPEVRLSPREHQVLRKLAEGATTAEIAQALVISQSTIKTHIRHLLEKLEASNRAQAVARAAAQGLLQKEEPG